ncbi:MAG: acetyl-CoA carboxylase biotin carboxylase subunit, partial [Firmicutes bacterium]|nr:acetyl-CoA carboxylase biotin carboxylase subunit [Bacillota bacterium]
MFQKVLVANRGEIAVRIIRACHHLGIAAVAVYSDADREALHVRLADEAYCIGPAPASQSYLSIPAILSAATVSGADAIHPGYGFLSENPDFREICDSCRIAFIGPNAEAMAQMGEKAAARRAAEAAGVPIVMGTGIIEEISEAKKAAAHIGYPVLIKAAAGGGGKGMRVVEKEEEFESTFR